MTIADTIQAMKAHTSNAYTAIQAKGGTMPTNKNLENLASSINSIAEGIEEVTTFSELASKAISANVGKYYLYTGATTGQIKQGNIYQITADGAIEFDKLSKSATITTNCTDCTANNPGTVTILGSATFTVAANGDYVLPASITVTGANYTYTRASSNLQATIVLSNVSDNVVITITAVVDATPALVAQILSQHGIRTIPNVLSDTDFATIKAGYEKTGNSLNDLIVVLDEWKSKFGKHLPMKELESVTQIAQKTIAEQSNDTILFRETTCHAGGNVNIADGTFIIGKETCSWHGEVQIQ